MLTKSEVYGSKESRRTMAAMVRLADMTRNDFMNGDISAAHGDQLGAERGDLRRRHRHGAPDDFPQQVR